MTRDDKRYQKNDVIQNHRQLDIINYNKNNNKVK